MEVLPLNTHQHSIERRPLIKRKSPYLSEWAKRTGGYFSISVVVIAWVIQTEILQAVPPQGYFQRPFFLISINHVSLMVLLPLQLGWYYLVQRKRENRVEGYTEYLRQEFGLTPYSILFLGMKFAILLTVTDYLWYFSLKQISMQVATSIMTSTSLFIYFNSVFFLKERFQWKKAIVILLGVLGVMLIEYFPGKDHAFNSVSGPTNEMIFAGLTLLSAVFSAIYLIQLKLDLAALQDDPFVVNIIAGSIGVSSIFLMFLGYLIYYYFVETNWFYEDTVISRNEVFTLILGAFFSVIINIFSMIAVLLTTPLITNMAYMLVIPLLGTVDWIIYSTFFSLPGLLGACLVPFAFVVIIDL